MQRIAILLAILVLFNFSVVFAKEKKITKIVMGFYQHELDETGDFSSFPRVTPVFIWYYPADDTLILAFWGGVITPKLRGLILNRKKFERICNKEVHDDEALLTIGTPKQGVEASYSVSYSVSVYDTFIFLSGLDTARGGVGIRIDKPQDYHETLYIPSRDLKVACSVLETEKTAKIK